MGYTVYQYTMNMQHTVYHRAIYIAIHQSFRQPSLRWTAAAATEAIIHLGHDQSGFLHFCVADINIVTGGAHQNVLTRVVNTACCSAMYRC